ncbi:MAG TPA: hypothetical protein VFB93_08580 [Burkholderiales bacterium]|nr:hypothetical protein [Burkholderiales bacterium]
MTKLFPLAIVSAALATLGACSTSTPPQTGGPSTQPNIVTNVHPYQAGTGVIQTVMPTPVLQSAAPSGAKSEPMQRLEIKMDNGTIQYVDTTSREFTRGTRVSLTQDRLIQKL